jgi:hypothetical protein
MDDFKKYLTDILIDLKENHFAVGIKADFEDEGTSLEELAILKNMSEIADLDLTVKIGGCGALIDIKEAHKIGAKIVVAPMIESPYAVKKYINTVNSVFNEQERKDTKFYINIETINGLKNLDEILDFESAKYIDGIVLGRTDLTESMTLNHYDVDSDIVLKLAKDTALKTKGHGKEFIAGGGVSPLSVKFFNKLGNNLDKYETRKIIFDLKSIHTGRAEEGIIKALEFEQIWISNKNTVTTNDRERMKIIESRISCLK